MSPIKKSCLFLQAFTETQKKRLLSWKQQVQKLFRSFPRKTLLDISGYRQQRKYVGLSFFVMHDGSCTSLLGFSGRDHAGHHSLSPSMPCVQITFLKQVGLGKGCKGEGFPEEELSVIFDSSTDMAKRTVSIRSAWRGKGCNSMIACQTVVYPHKGSQRGQKWMVLSAP